MKILIDIGNTNTSIALMRGTRIYKRYFIHTSKTYVSPEAFRRLMGASLSDISEAVIVSVVPKFNKIMVGTIKKTMPRTSVKIVGRDISVPIKINYRKPDEVGQDRLVVAYAASCLYGSPVIVVDFGTAVTFDLVSPKGEYEGGLIFPGVRLGMKALVENTALLPEIELKHFKGVVGKDTRGSMLSGILTGYGSLCDGIIERMRSVSGEKIPVVATGGDAALLSKYARNIGVVDADLVFHGLDSLS
ncbi:MAG: type III pantothenate kinase [Candidatus Omnitrophica bacterium]|nr:type III pantothenate kinase [Candidatus Omnitrophota bacterium]MDD5488654.1 type III pantothenate kinase [Candidatus Omnitrophota bacterium]